MYGDYLNNSYTEVQHILYTACGLEFFFNFLIVFYPKYFVYDILKYSQSLRLKS